MIEMKNRSISRDELSRLYESGRIRPGSIKQVEEILGVAEKKVSKFGNKKTMVDDIEFDSIREANYYRKLKPRLKAGDISYLKRQVEYELNPGGTYSLTYRSDFEFYDRHGYYHVVDVKGFQTTEYKKKKKLMKKVHGISIEEDKPYNSGYRYKLAKNIPTDSGRIGHIKLSKGEIVEIVRFTRYNDFAFVLPIDKSRKSPVKVSLSELLPL